MSFTTLHYEKIDGVALATFATPDNLNGITEERLDVRALILAAEGAAIELKTLAHYNRTTVSDREGYTAFREKRVPSWKAA